MSPNFGTPKNIIIFHLFQMEKLLFIGDPILKHITVQRWQKLLNNRVGTVQCLKWPVARSPNATKNHSGRPHLIRNMCICRLKI